MTDPIEVDDGDGLPDLTANQTAFVHHILAGKTASDAYRAAYDCSGMASNSIWVEASRVRSSPNVSLWLAQARKAGLSSAICTLGDHVAELQRLKELALESGNVGAAVQAEQLRGKAAGHYVEQFRELKDQDPAETLKEIAALSPDLARQLAKQADIDWPEQHTLQ